jgi:hypothetical protein
MQRHLFRMLLLAGLMAWLGSAADLSAQSKKKKGGPVVELDGMKSQVYDFWKVQKTDEDAANLTIVETSQKADDVIAGWKGDWTPPKYVKSGKIDDVTRIENFKVGGANVTKMTVLGTYAKDGKKMEDYRMQAYVFEGKNKKYTIQVLGPFKTVGLHMPDLDPWVKEFK